MPDEMKGDWLDHCRAFAQQESEHRPHERKVLRNKRVTLELDESLTLEDVGYTSVKMTRLEKLYLHEASRDAAMVQWDNRKGFASVAFHCFNHETKIAGLHGEQGPCLCSVVVTQITKNHVVANVAYRSTEFFKKFPADVAFCRDKLLAPFNVSSITFHLANVTVHPLYFAMLYPLFDDPIAELRSIEGKDPWFWRVTVRESKDLLCGGIKNFVQAQRVSRHVLERMDRDTLKELQAYLRASSPTAEEHD
jgi:hypothetical protein